MDEGHLDLDDQVTDVLPELTLADGVTVRQLLSHSRELHDHLDASFDLAVREDRDRAWTPAELLERVSREAREFEPPGAQHRYSSTNYVVAGLLVEELTGASLRDNVRTRITEPLGMTRTDLSREGPEPVTGFSPVFPGGSTESVSFRALETSAGAAGGIVSNAPDLVAFATALADGRLVSPQSLAEMTRFTDLDDGVRVGLGLFQDAAGRTGHDGNIHGYRSLVTLPDPSGRVVVVLSNDGYVNVFALTEAVDPRP